MKVCSKCKTEKSLSGFYKDKSKNDGLMTVCIDCKKEYRKIHYWSDPDKHRNKTKEWRSNNLDKHNESNRKWRLKNPEKQKQSIENWHNRNPGKRSFYVSRRFARKRRATPRWADWEEIEYIYNLARERGLEVDHIVPLKSKYVCGLHCADNLRCISEKINTFKSNRYWPDMPEEVRPNLEKEIRENG